MNKDYVEFESKHEKLGLRNLYSFKGEGQRNTF